ncbi:right-handed parallel beta-helix repeat-containing protein [Plantibacter flavus]|uniref:right-handed parallel beta-helix repeat-containing protein n=1 Tax=Plantibacter flavus TaxID=150123 RepID=UPI003F140357
MAARSRRRLIVALAVVAVAGLIATAVTVVAASAPWRAGADLAADTFDRTDQPGWGVPDLGGPYRLSGASAFSLAAGTGIVSLEAAGTAAEAAFTGTVLDDGLLSASFTPTTIPATGSGLRIGLVARSSEGFAYRAVAKIAPSGRIDLTADRVDGTPDAVTALGTFEGAITTDAGTRTTLQFRVTGTGPVSLDARVWTGSSAQAPEWRTLAQDGSPERLQAAGGAALWAYASASGGPAALAVSSLSARPVERSVLPGTEQDDAVTPPLDPDAAGALPVADFGYPTPAGARFVDRASGDDTGDGSRLHPFSTISDAIVATPTGGTIIVSAGVYRETLVVPPEKRLTIQNAVGQEVWLDGSRPVTGFREATDGTWVRDGWSTHFDDSPSYARGKPDSTEPGWSFVDPAHPMAAHPDQVWVDVRALSQVASTQSPGEGEFAVDETRDRLILGSDPSSATVEASVLVRAVTIQSSGSVFRGINARRFAPSVPDMGAVRVDRGATDVTIQNIVVSESATTGVSVGAQRAVLDRVTSTHNGMLGVHAVYADGFIGSRLRVEGNNTEHFNAAPVAGGLKLTRSRDVTVSGGTFSGNEGNGLWFDEAVVGVEVLGNRVAHNTKHGVMFELSTDILAAGNTVTGNDDAGIKAFSSDRVRLWNNTVLDNWMDIVLSIDGRVATDPDAVGRDPRQAFPDPTLSWAMTDVLVANTVVGEPRQGTGCVVCVTDARSDGRTELGVRLAGNLYQRADRSAPKSLIVWPGRAAKEQYADLAEFESARRQPGAGVEVDGRLPVDAHGRLSTAVQRELAPDQVPIPGDLRSLLGLAPGQTGAGRR